MAAVIDGWRAHTENVVGHLVRLLDHGGSVHPDDIDAALHARTAVLDLATTVHLDVSGLRRTPPKTYQGVERYTHPVDRLVRVLQVQARPEQERSLVDCLTSTGRDEAGQRWQEVARSAVLARHEWMQLPPDDRRLGPAGWTAMHEVAQLASAITWLDEGIANSCREAGRKESAQLLLDGAAVLRPAAAVVAELASSGPLHALPDPLPPTRRAVLVIRRPEHLPAALDRLAHLLRAADHVGPDHVQRVFRILGRVTADATAVWSTTQPLKVSEDGAPGASGDLLPAGVLEGALEHSELLHTAGRAVGRATTLEPSDPLVLAQVHVIATVAGQQPLRSAAVRGTPGAARLIIQEVLRASTAATTALRGSIVRSLEDRRWYVLRGETASPQLIWQRSRPHHADPSGVDAPKLLVAASRAASQAEAFASTLPPRETLPLARGPAAGVMARGSQLAQALMDAERRSAPFSDRPPEPARRPSR